MMKIILKEEFRYFDTNYGETKLRFSPRARALIDSRPTRIRRGRDERCISDSLMLNDDPPRC